MFNPNTIVAKTKQTKQNTRIAVGKNKIYFKYLNCTSFESFWFCTDVFKALDYWIKTTLKIQVSCLTQIIIKSLHFKVVTLYEVQKL